MLLNSHISAYTRCVAEKVCGLVRSTWGTSQGEDKLGARDKILNTKVARRACAGRAPGKHSPSVREFPQLEPQGLLPSFDVNWPFPELHIETVCCKSADAHHGMVENRLCRGPLCMAHFCRCLYFNLYEDMAAVC